ncbi:MAG: ArnT family glycosyltransferase [Bacteroidia bacterium]
MNKLNFIRVGFFIVLFIIVRFVLKFDGLYGQDAYEYLRYTNEMYSFFVKGTLLGDYFWGLGYPFFGCLFNFLIQNTTMALQLVSIVAALVTWIYIDKIIELIYDENPNYLVSFLFFMLSPIVIIHGFVVMSDMLATCLTIMAIYYLLHFYKFSKTSNYILGFFLSMLAIQTRYASIVVLLLFIAITFIKIIKSKNYKLLLYSAVIVVIISTPHILLRSTTVLGFTKHQFLTSWNFMNIFRSSFSTVEGESHNKFINLVYVFYSFFHPQFLAFGLIVILIAIKNKFKIFTGNKFQNMMLGTIIIYALFLGGISFQNKRFLVLSFPLVILFCYPVLKQILTIDKFSKHLIIGVLVSQFSFIVFFGKNFYERNKLEQIIATDLTKYSGKTIYIFEIDLALKGRDVQLDYQNIWYKEYASFNKNALVLVNGAQLEKQWIGKNPLINWNKLKLLGNLKVVKSYGDGWYLYQVQ